MVFMVQQEQYLNKYKLLCLALMLFIFSCKEEIKTTINQTEKAIPNNYQASTTYGFVLHQDTLFLLNQRHSGYVYQLADNGKDSIFFAGYYDGLLEGEVKKWFPNKQIWETRWYKAGKKNGPQISYWENGKKRFEYIAIDDVSEGEMNEWSVDGKISHIAHFVNGQEEGVQKSWYDNGKIKSNYVIISGKRYGLLGTKNCKNVSDSIFVVK